MSSRNQLNNSEHTHFYDVSNGNSAIDIHAKLPARHSDLLASTSTGAQNVRGVSYVISKPVHVYSNQSCHIT